MAGVWTEERRREASLRMKRLRKLHNWSTKPKRTFQQLEKVARYGGEAVDAKIAILTGQIAVLNAAKRLFTTKEVE